MAIQARTITLNIQPNFAITPRVNVSQYDKGVPIEFVLMDGLLEASLPSGATAKVQGTRPSGVGFSHACTISGNVLTVDSTPNMTGEAGQIPAEVVIEYSGDVIGTANFFLNVERSPHPDGTIDGDIIEQATLVERLENLETETNQNTTDIAQINTELTDVKSDITELQEELLGVDTLVGSGVIE